MASKQRGSGMKTRAEWNDLGYEVIQGNAAIGFRVTTGEVVFMKCQVRKKRTNGNKEKEEGKAGSKTAARKSSTR